jgi:hypothetical protein
MLHRATSNEMHNWSCFRKILILRVVKPFQNELEEVTEKLSEMVARPYLRTPRPVIIQTTTLARRKRHEFVRAVSKGLIPPETPPTLRKVRKRRFPSLMAMDPVDDVSIVIIPCQTAWTNAHMC